jgi:hypothetical protein
MPFLALLILVAIAIVFGARAAAKLVLWLALIAAVAFVLMILYVLSR